jgi:hypothetical protein
LHDVILIMDFVDFKKHIITVSDAELLELLEFVSNEVKRRNNLMSIEKTSPEEAVQKLIEALFPDAQK